MTKSYDKAQLSEIARKARIDVIKMISGAASGHPGGSLSLIEMIVALYTNELKHDPTDVCMVDRDRFVLSKGHGIPALYAVMAQLGYWDREGTMSLRTLESPFQGHPDRCRLPGMEASTGSLGQGLSIAVGFAMASRMDENSVRTYCIIGDGESQEGQVWEAAMCAPKYKLDNLVCFIDNNKVQLDGYVSDIMPIEPIADKWKAFGWHVISIDGHDFDQIFAALDEARATKGKPTFIIADTVKGKGVSFMENKVDWHGVAPNAEQAEAAILELENRS